MHQPQDRLSQNDGSVTAGAVFAAFRYAFEQIGGAETLADWALANPDKFFALLARVAFRPDVAPPPVWAAACDTPLEPEQTLEEWMEGTRAYLASIGEQMPDPIRLPPEK